MAKMKKYALKEEFVQVPNETAKAVEWRHEGQHISLQALGLITNIWSYNVEEWDLHRTELYKRYAKNKETSVRSAFNELIEAKYMIEFRYRSGKKYEHVYIYRIQPLTDEEFREIIEDGVKEYGKIEIIKPEIWGLENPDPIKIWGLDFQDPKMGTPKWGPQNHEESNNISKQEKQKKNSIKEKLNVIDDDEYIISTIENNVCYLELIMFFEQNEFLNRKKDSLDVIRYLMKNEFTLFTMESVKAAFEEYKKQIALGGITKKSSYFAALLIDMYDKHKTKAKFYREREEEQRMIQERIERNKHLYYNWLEEGAAAAQ